MLNTDTQANHTGSNPRRRLLRFGKLLVVDAGWHAKDFASPIFTSRLCSPAYHKNVPPHQTHPDFEGVIMRRVSRRNTSELDHNGD